MNKTSEYFVYLNFDIHNKYIQKIGEVSFRVNKKDDIEIWKNPNSIEQKVIDFFLSERPQYQGELLRAFYTGDLIPNI